MYTRKKSLAEEIFTSNSDKNPSFSSTLLDEIYRTLDEDEDTTQTQKKRDENEEIAGLRVADFVEKWRDKKKVEEKIFTKRPPLIPDYLQQLSSQDNDPMFFSSTSNSSLSSSGVLSSASDTEYFAAVEKTKTSCFFGPSWPKPIRTKVPISSSVSSVSHERKKTEDSLKSRLESVKVYENLKNFKHPISPGARLTNFINSIFANGSSKKRSKAWNDKKDSVLVGSEQNWCPFNPKSAQKSVCSSASSFSRSILCKSPSTTSTSTNASKGKSNSQEISTRKVSFDPVSVVVDGESRAFGYKCIEEKGYENRKKDDIVVERDESGGEDDDDDDEEGSDCSSELFEIDHLALFGEKRFCEELPVYETTDLAKNLAIARGMMR